MASRRCGCASDSCSCVINPTGEGINVSGTGSATNPYVIDADPHAANLTVENDGIPVRSGVTTIDFQGTGVTASPGDADEVVVTVATSTGGGGGGTAERPVGEVTMWLGPKASIPAGWLALDGSTFSDVEYPDLADLLGTTTLPDFTDRFPIGAGPKAQGSSGGAATHHHALTSPKAHALISPFVGGLIAANRVTVASYATNMQWDYAGSSTTPQPQTVAASLRGDTENASEGLPPWRALWFVIRAG